MQQLHRRAVTQVCGLTRLRSENRACARRRQTCLRTICSSASRLSRSPRIVGNTGPLSSGTVAEPSLEQLDGLAAQRRATLLAAFALAADVRAGAEHYVAAAQVDQFGGSQAGLDREEEMAGLAGPPMLSGPARPTAPPFPRRRGSPPFASHSACWAWRGCAGNAAAERFVHRDIAEEGADRGEAGVSAPGAVAPRGLDMAEEVADQFGVDILDPRVWSAACRVPSLAYRSSRRNVSR